MARKKLILHIGTHKTATTTIQRALFEGTKTLHAHGFHYGDTSRSPGRSGRPRPPHPSLSSALLVGGDKPEAEFAAIHKDFDRSEQDTLVLSTERLSFPDYDQFTLIRPLTDAFDTEIVVFFRRQDSFIESLWSQLSGERGRREARDIEEFANAPYNRARLDYPRIADFWSNFGTVRAVSFDENRRDILGAFTRTCGMPALEKVADYNISPSMHAAAMMNMMNRQGQDFRPKRLSAAFKGVPLRHALGRRLRTEILAECAEINADLSARYGVRFGDEMPADEPDAPLRAPSEKALTHAIAALMAPAAKAPRSGGQAGRSASLLARARRWIQAQGAR